ncbi:MAG: D-alanine--D-alanine ligase [Wenzhouxiangella sp.]|nr:D-alanine--D-alanine ligase [Wenzhouxiangella sp.]MDR9453565.1 D-alanine--D-alanine ligase [Wenzhouxiangella sp.]
MMRIDPSSVGHVALVAGGDSAERSISLKGADAVAQALTRLGVNFSRLDGARAVVDQVGAGHFDRVFNLLHGRGGEDGALQGALRLYGVPMTGSGVLASALTMSKVQTKRIWQATGLPTPAFRTLNRAECQAKCQDSAGQVDDQAIASMMAGLEGPVFVKPNREGSSLGMSRITDRRELPAALNQAFGFDDQVLVEQLIDGRELTVGWVGSTILPVIELKTPRAFYDFDAKYAASDTEYVCPAQLPNGLSDTVADLTQRAVDATGARGWGRVDFMVDGDHQPWLLEINTTPGMTPTSLLPKAALAHGMTFEELVWQILSQAEIA